MGSLGQSTTMKTFLIFSACLLTIIIAYRGRQFNVVNCLGDRINVKLDMYADSCADRIPQVGMFGMPRGGYMTYGDPQPSCRVQRISADFAGRKRPGCSVDARYICSGNKKCDSFTVIFNPPAPLNETDSISSLTAAKIASKSFCRIVVGNRC